MSESDTSTRWMVLRGRIDGALARHRSERALSHAQRDSSVSVTQKRPAMAATSHPRRRRTAMIGAGIASVAVIVVLFLGPGSMGIWWNQRSQTTALEAKIATLDDANTALATRAKELNDPQTIEAIARRNYGMVPKGSKAYAILPSSDGSDELGGTWPFVDLTRTAPAAP